MPSHLPATLTPSMPHGPSSRPVIPLSVPHLEQAALAHVVEALAQNWVAHVGPSVDAFENELAAALRVPAAFATNSGTAALHLALRVCGVGRGDRVFCSALTFVASANPILYLGAQPTFIDAEPDSWGMSPAALERALADARCEGVLPKAIVVVSLYGQSADMAPLLAIANAYGVPVVEDAAQGLGASYDGRPCGTHGHLGIYSFAGNKIITTSAGGALVSHDAALVARARLLGMQARDPEDASQHLELGYNYRLSNVLAGLGRAQLSVLFERVAARRAVFARYSAALDGMLGTRFMPEHGRGQSTRWLSVLLLAPDSGWEPAHFIAALADRKIEARRVFRPLHTQPFLRSYPYYSHKPARSVSEELFGCGLCLPSSSSLTPEEQAYVIENVQALLWQPGRYASEPRASASASITTSATPSTPLNSAASACARLA